MVNTGQYGQLIILNNTDATPTTHFEQNDSTELIFGEHEAADRRGLLLDMREGDDSPNTTGEKQLSLFDE